MRIHVRYDGNSQTLDCQELGIEDSMPDEKIKEAIAGIYQVPTKAFKNLVVDRHPDGIIVRPSAVFG